MRYYPSDATSLAARVRAQLLKTGGGNNEELAVALNEPRDRVMACTLALVAKGECKRHVNKRTGRYAAQMTYTLVNPECPEPVTPSGAVGADLVAVWR